MTMKPLRLTRIKVSQDIALAEARKATQQILLKIKPMFIYLFGSATRDDFTDQSDIDLLLVFKTKKDLRTAQKNLGNTPPQVQYSVEITWTLLAEFERKKNMGGVCQEAFTAGQLLFSSIAEGSNEP